MSRKKIPVARILIFFSWAVPLLTAAAAAAGLFLQDKPLFISGIFLLLSASLIPAVLLRMCANLTQMVFEMQNTLQYTYKEHSQALSSLAANVQSMRKEDIPSLIRETNARLLAGSSEAAEGVSEMTRLLSRIAEGLDALPGRVGPRHEEDILMIMREMSTRILSGNVEAGEGMNALSAQSEKGFKEFSARLAAMHAELERIGKDTHKDELRSCLEDLRELKSSCAQVSCDTRDISAFFNLMEKHLNIKKT
ncbi:MAG: hypothetical protein WC329_00780 [Candidatus Omnitrophota bacterium]|jgi:hypothetical protein